jgi:hypothetical protein
MFVALFPKSIYLFLFVQAICDNCPQTGRCAGTIVDVQIAVDVDDCQTQCRMKTKERKEAASEIPFYA